MKIFAFRKEEHKPVSIEINLWQWAAPADLAGEPQIGRCAAARPASNKVLLKALHPGTGVVARGVGRIAVLAGHHSAF